MLPADTGIFFFHPCGDAFGTFLISGSVRSIVGRDTRQNLCQHDAFPYIERLCLGYDLAVAVKDDRNDIQLQFFRQIESSFMETLHPSVVGTCSFGENGDGISFFHLLAHPFHVKLVTVSYVIEIGIADNGSEERRVPYPVIGNHDQFGSQCQ